MSAAGAPQGARPWGRRRAPLGAYIAREARPRRSELRRRAAPNLVDAPKIVQGHAIASYQIHEECLACSPASASSTGSRAPSRWIQHPLPRRQRRRDAAGAQSRSRTPACIRSGLRRILPHGKRGRRARRSITEFASGSRSPEGVVLRNRCGRTSCRFRWARAPACRRFSPPRPRDPSGGRSP